jgi:hypothetical protein
VHLNDYISTTLLLLLDLYFGVGTSKKRNVGDVYAQHVFYSMYLLSLPPVHCPNQYTTTTVIIVVAVLVTLNILIFLVNNQRDAQIIFYVFIPIYWLFTKNHYMMHGQQNVKY